MLIYLFLLFSVMFPRAYFLYFIVWHCVMWSVIILPVPMLSFIICLRLCIYVICIVFLRSLYFPVLFVIIVIPCIVLSPLVPSSLLLCSSSPMYCYSICFLVTCIPFLFLLSSLCGRRFSHPCSSLSFVLCYCMFVFILLSRPLLSYLCYSYLLYCCNSFYTFLFAGLWCCVGSLAAIFFPGSFMSLPVVLLSCYVLIWYYDCCCLFCCFLLFSVAPAVIAPFTSFAILLILCIVMASLLSYFLIFDIVMRYLICVYPFAVICSPSMYGPLFLCYPRFLVFDLSRCYSSLRFASLLFAMRWVVSSSCMEVGVASLLPPLCFCYVLLRVLYSPLSPSLARVLCVMYVLLCLLLSLCYLLFSCNLCY